MRGMIHYWRGQFERHPVLIGWAVIFIVHAGMNANLGYEIGGASGPAAWAYAAGFIGFAILGAWAADEVLAGGATGSRRYGLLALALGQLAIGQMAGWQSFGLTLSKGAGQIEAKAETRKSTADGLKAARAELARIGIVRPVPTIEAEEKLECTIKGKAFKDGIGPKCTALRAEIETAKRARHLEGQVETLTKQLAAGPNIKDGNAVYSIPQGLANWVRGQLPGEPRAAITPEDVQFFWLILLVFALEFFGTFGLALIRGRDGDGSDAHHDRGATPGHLKRARDMGNATLRDAVDAVVGALPAPRPMLALAGPASAPDYAPNTGANAYGAPINLYIGSGAAGPLAASPHVAGAETGVAQTPPSPPRPRRDLAALSADAPPVDRSRVVRTLTPEEREAADVILAFRAACIVDTPGGIVVASDIWKRYRHWAGERALGEAPFLALLADVTGIEAVDIGGHLHARGVALRVGTKLEAVA